MFKIKQIGVAVAAMGLAGVAFAGSYSEDCCEVMVPKHAGGVRVGVEALYFNADVKDTEYAITHQTKDSIETFRSHNVSSDRDWGFAVELAYVAAGTGNDFAVNWTSHEMHGSDSIALAGAGNNGSIFATAAFFADYLDDFTGAFTPVAHIGEDTELSSAKGSYDVDYTKIDFEMGQMIKIGRDSVTLRFHTGVRYADIDSKMTAVYAENGNDDTATFSAESDFDGFGPRVGVDGAWHLANGFSFISEVSAALLVGDASVTQKYSTSDNASPASELKLAHRVSYDNKIVSNLEARLGVNYMHHFSNSSELNVQVGYQVTNYFDADYKLNNSGSDVAFNGFYGHVNYTI